MGTAPERRAPKKKCRLDTVGFIMTVDTSGFSLSRPIPAHRRQPSSISLPRRAAPPHRLLRAPAGDLHHSQSTRSHPGATLLGEPQAVERSRSSCILAHLEVSPPSTAWTISLTNLRRRSAEAHRTRKSATSECAECFGVGGKRGSIGIHGTSYSTLWADATHWQPKAKLAAG